jgi:hypothetical protein
MAAIDASIHREAPLLVRLMGGLGNQMFQYAAARALADRWGVDVLFDPRYVRRKAQHTGLAIDAFAIRAKEAPASVLKKFPEWQYKFTRAARHWWRPLGGVFHECKLGVDPRLLMQKPGTLLAGFWQSQSYFESAATRLREDFVLATPWPNAAQALAQEMAEVPSVGIHLRRGDYVSNALAAQRHGVCSADYYRKALEWLGQEVGDLRCFVFTDDESWVRANIPLPAQTVYASGLKLRPEHDLVLMSRCKHQIIANSTFAWWGAWLNPNTNKRVVAPTPWYDAAELDGSAIVPAQWHREIK